MNWLALYFQEVLLLFAEMAPFLVLGFLIAGILHAFVSRKSVAKHLGKDNLISSLKAAMLGVPMPLCSCGVIPTGIGLRKRGASRSATVSFLISTPQTGVDSMLVTYGFFGWTLAIFRPVAAFISGILGGLAVLLLGKENAEEEHWLKHHLKSEDALESAGEKKSFAEKMRSALHFSFNELLGDIAFWLLIGVLIAALISVMVPADFFSDTVGEGWPQMLIMMAFGIPLYVCSTASVPIAAVLMSKGISAGAAFVFLMTGPATNAATMVIIGRVMGRRVLTVYLLSIALLALGFGWGLEFLVASTGLTVNPGAIHIHGGSAWLSYASAIVLGALMLRHFAMRIWKRIHHARAKSTSDNVIQLAVEGMHCSHCVETVTDSLNNVEGVSSATVSLDGHAEIHGGKIDRERLIEAVRSVGYGVKGEAKKVISLTTFDSSSKGETH